jgi:hypothetical protein
LQNGGIFRKVRIAARRIEKRAPHAVPLQRRQQIQNMPPRAAAGRFEDV